MSDRRVPPPTKLPSLITTPMSWLYSIAISWKNRQFDAGKGVSRLDQPVISIGNLSTGGTGKTPMVHLIVGMLQGMGKHPVIAMRGYGAKPGEKGDEQLEHERALPGVPIVAQPDRLAGLRALFSGGTGGSYDCVVLDDGFQHRKIARDLDIVLIDATRPPERDALLPRGHLRESMASLARADLIILTHSEHAGAPEIARIRSVIAQYADAGVISASHLWTRMVQYTRLGDGWESSEVAREDVSALRVIAASAIGNPESFVHTATASGMQLERVHQLPDHAQFQESQARGWSDELSGPNADAVLMTRKDWVKASRLKSWRAGDRVIVPVLSMKLDDERKLHEHLLRVSPPPDGTETR
jgi:tetraacyldisaccharide 4'-kinase